jgi:radical SAM protein with 4Fe4S-binding SPASM domain
MSWSADLRTLLMIIERVIVDDQNATYRRRRAAADIARPRCIEPHCDALSYCKGRCVRHYQAHRRAVASGLWTSSATSTAQIPTAKP